MEMFTSKATMATGSSGTIAITPGIIQAGIHLAQVRWTVSSRIAIADKHEAATMAAQEVEADRMAAVVVVREAAVEEEAVEGGSSQYQSPVPVGSKQPKQPAASGSGKRRAASTSRQPFWRS